MQPVSVRIHFNIVFLSSPLFSNSCGEVFRSQFDFLWICYFSHARYMFRHVIFPDLFALTLLSKESCEGLYCDCLSSAVTSCFLGQYLVLKWVVTLIPKYNVGRINLWLFNQTRFKWERDDILIHWLHLPGRNPCDWTWHCGARVKDLS